MRYLLYNSWRVLIPLTIFVAFIVVLSYIPKFDGENRRSASCASNLKQIYLGYYQYIRDYDDRYPRAVNGVFSMTDSSSWIGQLQPYLKSSSIFICPGSLSGGQFSSSFAYNTRLSQKKQSDLGKVELLILNFEVKPRPDGWTQTGTGFGAVTASTRHLGGANYSFVDGHVKWLEPGQLTGSPTRKEAFTFVPADGGK